MSEKEVVYMVRATWGGGSYKPSTEYTDKDAAIYTARQASGQTDTIIWQVVRSTTEVVWQDGEDKS